MTHPCDNMRALSCGVRALRVAPPTRAADPSRRIIASRGVRDKKDLPTMARRRRRRAPLPLRASSRDCDDDDDTFFPSLLPPFRSRPTETRDLGGGVYVLEQPCGFLASAIGQPFPDKGLAALTVPGYGVQRCVVVRLLSGELFVYSAVAPTKEAIRAVRALGDVAHIVFPCTAPEEWYFIPAFADAFPGATISAAPGILYSEEGYIPWAKDVRTPSIERIKRSRDPRVLATGDGFGVENREVVADVWYAGPLYSEVTFVHEASGTLICGDSLVGVERRGEEGGGGGGGGGVGLASPVTRRLVRKSRASAEAWVDGMCSRWGGFSRVVPTRGALAPVDADPTAVRNLILDEKL